jgi:hypothetical protein
MSMADLKLNLIKLLRIYIVKAQCATILDFIWVVPQKVEDVVLI